MAMAQAGTGRRRSFYADLDRLRTHFDSLDQERTGYIGYSELKQLVERMSDIEDAVLPDLMAELDRDKDGKVSFEDFQALFELENEKKRMKIAPPKSSTAESKAKCDVKSPVRTGRRLPEIPTVTMRSKPGRSQLGSQEFGHISPIRSQGKGRRSRPPSSDFTELGGMQYLMVGMDTTDSASPQLKRNSKVLTIFSEPEDVLEGTGDVFNLNNTSNYPSPPMSPMATKNQEEVSHVVGVLESVISGKDVNRESIAKLCAHLEADEQEEQELLTLLNFLDKKRVGSVTVEEFARGLQDCKNTAEVSSTPFKSPESFPPSRRHTIATEMVPRLSEPFTPVHSGVRQSSTPLASTPLHQPAYSNLVLSVLDPDHSGYVKVESLVDQIQDMGVEADHNSSLEEALAEAVPVNPSGLVNVSEFTNSLEGALLTEGKTNNLLRQIAVKTFHSEIHSLRSQVLQISMERDTLQQNLSRTQDENKKLVQMGEEQVDLVTKQSEQKLKYQENELTQRLRATERTRREEQLHLENRYTDVLEDLQMKLDKVKTEEERLRDDLKLARDEITLTTKELSKAHQELSQKDSLISLLQRDLESRSDYDLVGEDQHSRLYELETDIAHKNSVIKNLEEKLRGMQDKFDLLYSDNEKMKQKYLTAKRDLQRRRTRKPSADKSAYSRMHKPKRPLSGSHFGRSSPIKPRIFRSPLDLAISAEENHPVLYEDMDDGPPSDNSEHDHSRVFSPYSEELGETEIPPDEVPAVVAEVEAAQTCAEVPADTTSTSSTEMESAEEDAYSRSSASLMEEFHKHEQKSILESKIKQLEEERQLLQVLYQQLEQQFREAEEEDKKVMLRELENTKLKQEDIRNSLIDNSGADSAGNLSDLIGELERMRTELQKQRESHDQSIASIKKQLSQAEESNDNQLDQFLRLEEEKAMADEKIRSLELEISSEKSGHEAEVNILMQKLDNAEQTIVNLEQKEQQSLAQLRYDIEQRFQAEMVEQARQADEKMALEMGQLQKKMDDSRLEYELHLEKVSKELEEIRNRETELNRTLSQIQEEYKSVQVQLKEAASTEQRHLEHIELLEESEVSLKQQFTNLCTDIEKYQQELAKLHNLQEEKSATNVSTQLPQQSSHRGEDESDFVPAPIYIPKKLPHSSTQDSHERIIGQMKGQLDELQTILQTKSGRRDKDAELTLVQELIASNVVLGKEMQQIKKTFEEEQRRLCELLSDKDKTLTELQLKVLNERAALQSASTLAATQIIDFIGNFKDNSDDSLSDYQTRVEEAAAKLMYIKQLLAEKNSNHVDTIAKVMSDLKSSREESNSYRQEVERLKQELDTSLRESSNRQPQAKLDQRVDAESGQIVHSSVEPDTAVSREATQSLLEQKEEISSLRNELEKLRRSERLAKTRSEQMESQLSSRERQLTERDEVLSSQAKRIQELETQLQTPVKEHVESVVQYVEVQPLEGVNEALFLNMNQDSRERVTIKSQIPVEETLPVTSTEPDKEQLRAALQAAEQRLEALQQTQKTIEMQHQQVIQETESKYEAELSVANEVIEEHTANLRELYLSVVKGGDKEMAHRLSHSQLIGEIGKEVNQLRSELASEQVLVNEMEATMAKKIAEHEQTEAQIQTEHDEEVRALHQQKQHLMRQLDEAKMRYHQLSKEQEQHSTAKVQELVSTQSELKEQLGQKAEESLNLYQQLAELKKEKRVLIDIVEHLCVEAGKLIDVV